MSLIIPTEFKKEEINSYSGFINSSSVFGKKTAKGLFLSQENKNYLANQLYSLLKNKDFIRDVVNKNESSFKLQANNLHQIFSEYKQEILDLTPELIETWKLPYREDVLTRNPVMELHLINKDFLLDTSRTIILNPHVLRSDIYDYNPDTGKKDIGEYEYGAASYSDGTWHPEHLFTESTRNQENPYWIPVNITFDSNPPKPESGAFHPRADHYSLNERRAKASKNKKKLSQPEQLPTFSRKNTGLGLLSEKRENFDVGKLRTDLYSADKIQPDFQDPAYYPEMSDLKKSSSGFQMLLDYFTEEDTKHEYYPAYKSDYTKFENTTSMLPGDRSYAGGPGPGNRYMYDFYGDTSNPDSKKRGFADGGLFPRWQYSVNHRPYQKNIDEALREGGRSDRRTQYTRGYDMSALLSKSTY